MIYREEASRISNRIQTAIEHFYGEPVSLDVLEYITDEVQCAMENVAYPKHGSQTFVLNENEMKIHH